MKPTPKGWPRISSGLVYEQPKAAIEWLCKAFGFEVRLLVEGENGELHHSELTLGDGLIMVGGTGHEERPWRKAPSEIGGVNTQTMFIYVDDVEAHCARARAAGAVIASEPKTTDYGEDYWADRTYEAIDPGGHHWWIAQRMSSGGK